MIYKLKKVLLGSLNQDDILKQAQTVLDRIHTNEDTEVQEVLTVKDVEDCIARKTREIDSKLDNISQMLERMVETGSKVEAE